MNKTTIEIFGKGCKNCKKLEENARKATDEIGLEVEVIKVTDMDEILNRGVFKTPGLAINGEVVSTGRILSSTKIKDMLK